MKSRLRSIGSLSLLTCLFATGALLVPSGSAQPCDPDTTPPTVTCPGNITQCNDPSLCSAIVRYIVVFSDNCGLASFDCTRSDGLPLGDPYPVPTTTVTCTAVDTAGLNASCNFTVTVNDCDGSCCELNKCPLSQGYWKTHASAWPVSSLTLGTVSYTTAELLAILKKAVGTGKKADASLILADQLIAAKLNLANGSNPCPIAAVIAAADALIGNRPIPITPKITPSSAESAPMVALANLLDQYNNGLLTPGCTP